MTDMEKVYLEGTDLDCFASVNIDQGNLFRETPSVEFVFYQAICQRSRLDWGINMFK